MKNRKKLIPLAAGLAGAALVAVGIWVVSDVVTRPPRVSGIILLSLDDLRADRLGCYGNPRDVSPCLDAMAEGGAQFLSAFTSYPFTPPSHLSMLTSLYPAVFDIPLDPGIVTLAEVFSDHGFRTAAFTAGGYMSKDYGVFDGFLESDDDLTWLGALQKKTVEWLERNGRRRFFLFLHTYYIHTPFQAPDDYFRMFADPGYKGPVQNSAERTRFFIDAANKGEISVNPEDVQRILDIYDAQIKRADDFVRAVVETLKRQGLEKQTLFIITSDHGEQFYEYGLFAHSSPERKMADISTRVPLIVHCPALPGKGKVESLVELTDIAPTVLDAAGLPIPDTFQGRSFYPLLDGRIPFLVKSKSAIYYTLPLQLGVRTKDWKMTLIPGGGQVQLFDLRRDPEERRDLSEDVSQRKRVASLGARLEAFQIKNSQLRDSLNQSTVRLEEGLPDRPLDFDDLSIMLAPCDDPAFFYRGQDLSRIDRIHASTLEFDRGRWGSALSLDGKGEAGFRVEAGFPRDSGAIEFWVSVRTQAVRDQDLFRLDFRGVDGVLSVRSSIANKGRISVELSDGGDRGLADIHFSTVYKPFKWHHVLIGWDGNEACLIVDGRLRSRSPIESPDLFDLGTWTSLTVGGDKSTLDDLRVSRSNRLEIRPARQMKLSPKVLERLKALGYIE